MCNSFCFLSNSFPFFFVVPQYLLLLKELPVEENLLPVDEVLKLLTPLS